MPKFLAPVDLNMNELRNGVIQNLATAPTSPTAGRIYFDTALNCLRVYSGTAWVSLVNISGPFNEKGVWNASTNTPTLVSSTGTDGDIYIVSATGTTTLDGISQWNTGDYIFFDGTKWLRVDNTEGVSVTTMNTAIAAAMVGVVKKYAQDIGDGTTTAIVVTHSLNTRDVQVRTRDNANAFAFLEPDIEATTVNTVTLRFTTAPAAAAYRVIIEA